jgi:hypothetical protein
MITSVFARRALLAAAVSATASLPQSQAFFADGPARTASANPAGKPTRAASYDPGSVNGELQRLFNEGGQEMPSMRSQDLPNARNMQSHLVRQKIQPHQNKTHFKNSSAKSPDAASRPRPLPPRSPARHRFRPLPGNPLPYHQQDIVSPMADAVPHRRLPSDPPLALLPQSPCNCQPQFRWMPEPLNLPSCSPEPHLPS